MTKTQFSQCNRPIFLFLIAMLVTSCQSEDTLFREIPSSHSVIHFNNEIIEDDTHNILEYEYIYNGGGVAVADFNNDGRQDLYFTGNMVTNRLYLNEGDLKFTDISEESGTGGGDKWYTGVAVVDINGDGWQDIYVSAARWNDPEQRRNELYVNSGINEEGIPEFEEMAAEYGLDDSSHSTQAAFFDYDNDGDLDMYLLVSDQRQNATGERARASDSGRSHPNRDKLFRNDREASDSHPKYTEVTETAGIDKSGYGLGIAVSDLNGDGYPDVYAANDFASSDLLWINNGDGTFENKAAQYFKHTSFSAMGTDIQDINNDGLPDVVTLDMLPENNYRKKTMTNPNNYLNYSRNAFGRIDPQITRNTLQLNRGPRWVGSDSIGPPIFSEIAFLSGIAETDWSWGPLLADFDHDGFRDLLVTNGTPRDKTDKDFVNYRDRLGNIVTQSILLDSIPTVKLPNYLYRNRGDLTFEDVSKKWGLGMGSYSNGAVWADLDNDGDLEIVINNINREAFVFENTLVNEEGDTGNWLQVELKSDAPNTNAVGSKIQIFYNGDKSQVYEYSPYTGYLSSTELVGHFGLGRSLMVDSLVVSLPQGGQKVWKQVKANQRFVADIRKSSGDDRTSRAYEPLRESWFDEVTENRGVKFEHPELEFDDYRYQRLQPHKLSQFGPSLAVGDVDNNGAQDLFIGGSFDVTGSFLMQDTSGSFKEKKLWDKKGSERKLQEDEGTLLFDADNDGDLDLYIVSGSVENSRGSENFRDRFYENRGDGSFTARPEVIPGHKESGMAVRAADYDRDGDLDLFIGGRVVPGFYPLPASSYIYRNDSNSGSITFTDVTPDVAEPLREIGMVSDALWSDFNNDGWVDLVLAGEWMPLTFLENREGILVEVTGESGLSELTGWWNSLAGGDFDNDGDTDYIAANLGLNSPYRASKEQPVSIYGKDFSNTGLFTGIPTRYIPDENGIEREYPVHPRNEVLQMLRRQGPSFQTHASYGRSDIHDLLSRHDLKDAIRLKANYLESTYLENKGDGSFSIHSLPVEAQFAPVFGMLADDFNGDGKLDVLLNGNEYGAQVQAGPYDALNGLLLKGKGDGTFTPVSVAESGIYIPGDGKALVKIKGGDNSYLVAASQNSGPLKLFQSSRMFAMIPFNPMDAYAMVYFEDGKVRKQEAYYGSSFQSASGRFLALPSNVDSVEIVNYTGETRVVEVD